MKRRIGWIAVGVVVIAGVGLTAAAATGFGFAPAAANDRPAPASTAKITEQDLVATKDENGTLGYAAESTLRAVAGGVVTWLPTAGATIERGGQLYRVDEAPTVLLYGSLPAYRTLEEGVKGPDVRQLEENLAALGYGGFDVDDTFRSATATAVAKWQADRGLAKTGVVEPSSVHVAPGALRVSSIEAQLGGNAGPDAALLKVSGLDRVVTVDLDPSEGRYAVVGAAVTISLADQSTFTGTISAVVPSVKSGQQTEPGAAAQDKTVLRVTIAPDDPAAITLPGTVTAKAAFAADQRTGVLAAPVTALLALAEGGYGVEVVGDDGTSRLVAVTTGLFAGGLVEVSGDGIAEGTKVAVAQ